MGPDIMRRYHCAASMSSVAEISAEEIYPTQIDHNETVILWVQGEKNTFLPASLSAGSVRGYPGKMFAYKVTSCRPYTVPSAQCTAFVKPIFWESGFSMTLIV